MAVLMSPSTPRRSKQVFNLYDDEVRTPSKCHNISSTTRFNDGGEVTPRSHMKVTHDIFDESSGTPIVSFNWKDTAPLSLFHSLSIDSLPKSLEVLTVCSPQGGARKRRNQKDIVEHVAVMGSSPNLLTPKRKRLNGTSESPEDRTPLKTPKGILRNLSDTSKSTHRVQFYAETPVGDSEYAITHGGGRTPRRLLTPRRTPMRRSFPPPAMKSFEDNNI
uniref:Uncharacterized protein n=1 Tax=Heterorhabditis bacteriophora TaxID=37862 RepID=A0A1I7WQ58_HETBA